MPVTEILMKPGSWSLTLKPDTPIHIRQSIQDWSLIVITLVRPGFGVLNRTNAIGQSIYTGVVRRHHGDRFQLGGPGILIYAGDEQNKGYQIASGFVGNTWAAMMTTLFTTGVPAGKWVNELTRDAPVSPPATTITTSIAGTPRQIMDMYAKQLGCEYKVLPNGHVASGAIGAGTFAFDKVLFMEGESGIEPGGGVTVVNASRLDLDSDVDSELSDVKCTSGGSSGSSGHLSIARDFAGGATDLYLERDITISNGTNSDCAAAAAGEATDYGQPKIAARVTFREYGPNRLMTPGDTVLAWALDGGLYNSGWSPMLVRGRSVFPLELQLGELTWPVETPRMGVLNISQDGNSIVTDLTDWILSEADRDSTATLGSIPRSLAASFAVNPTLF